jgi:hypothetical protein
MPILTPISKGKKHSRGNSEVEQDEGSLGETEGEIDQIKLFDAGKPLLIGDYFEMEVGMEGAKVRFSCMHIIF